MTRYDLHAASNQENKERELRTTTSGSDIHILILNKAHGQVLINLTTNDLAWCLELLILKYEAKESLYEDYLEGPAPARHVPHTSPEEQCSVKYYEIVTGEDNSFKISQGNPVIFETSPLLPFVRWWTGEKKPSPCSPLI